MQNLARFVLFDAALTRRRRQHFQIGDGPAVLIELGLERRHLRFQSLRFGFSLTDPLLDGGALLGLILQASSRTLHFHVQLSQSLSGFGEPRLGLITGGLHPRVLLLASGHRFGKRA